MSFYENLVMQTQMNYSRYYSLYAAGKTPYALSEKPSLPYEEQIECLVKEIKEAECVLVGGASGLSAAGGGDFYYEDNASYRKYFGKFAEKYHFKGAFDGMMRQWDSREEFWGYLATFLYTTQTAEIREPYRDLDSLLQGKDFFCHYYQSGYPVCKTLFRGKSGGNPGRSSLFSVHEMLYG